MAAARSEGIWTGHHWRVLLVVAASLSMSLAARPSASRNVVFGLNPALQRSIKLVVDLDVGAVNRGASATIGIGGKGQDVFIAARSMEAELPLVAQLVGTGAEGDTLMSLLTELAGPAEAATLHRLTVRSSARLRNAITLLSPKSQEATEVVEPSGPVTEQEIEQLKAQLRETPPASGVAVMGSMPPGCPPSLYSDLLPLCTDEQSTVLLDIVSSVVPTMAALQGRVGRVVLKVNIKELCAVAGRPVPPGSDSAGSRSGELLAAATALASQLASACSSSSSSSSSSGSGSGSGTSATNAVTSSFICATDGAFSAHLLQLTSRGTVGKHVTYTLPPLPRPLVNPIGAGDAVASGTIMAATGKVRVPGMEEVDIIQAFRWGLACGAASCLGPTNSAFTRRDAEEIFAVIGVDSADSL